MYLIEEEFEDLTHPRGKRSVRLNPNQGLNPYTIKYPLIWSGHIGNNEVEIIQLESFAGSINSFEFKKFPDEFENIKGQIIQWIDNKLRTMD